MNKLTHRSGFKVMSSLMMLLNSLVYIMLLAIFNGSLGFVSSMSVVIFGVVGIAKSFGENIALSYTAIFIIIGISGLLRGALRYCEQYSNHYIAFKLLATLRSKIFITLRALAPAKLDQKQKGGIISMITADIETLEIFYAHTISPIAIAFLVCTSIILVLGFYVNWFFALIAITTYLIIGVFVPMVTSKKLRNSSYKYRKEFTNLNSYMLESIEGLQELISFNAIPKRLSAIKSKSNHLLKSIKKQKIIVSKNNAIFDLLITFFIIITVVAVVLMHYYDNLSIGKLLIALSIIYTGFGPVIALANLPSTLSATFTSGNRILNLLEEKPIVNPVINANDIEFNELDINRLNFSYDNEIKILKNINLNIKKGEVVGIIGPSGSGKSTLLKLIMRFHPVDANSIKLNNIDINDINSKNLHSNITMLNQNTYLFNMSIRDNLLLANPDASEKEIIDACKKADIHNFIIEQEKAYDTEITSLAQNISAGQKQRLGLARALLTNSSLILLDEPTSNVDILSEKEILNAINKIKKDKAIIIVSHRPTTMSVADRVYKMKNNQIKEI